jgi:UDP-GlcNAc:undecaprenyl-phosphate/decaprenyl-phosphate GlcNAc-1-phosphate transferase
MFQISPAWLRIVLSFVVALAVSYYMTPHVKSFAERVGAVDVPRDDRRVHDHPIPRMGGLAIFAGFVVSLLLFVSFSNQVIGLLLGALIIAAMGAIDDIVNLKPWIKLTIQIIAALVAIRSGIFFNAVSNPNFRSDVLTIPIGSLSIPLTILWIVGCTNAVNLIDGLDGLACGVSAISSITMLIVSLFVADLNTTFILAALCGGCIGFIPYNLNPAKIFMGDVGSQFLGFVLACVSIMGLFKLHTVITFLVPVLAMAIPLADTVFAFFRRILHGQSPFHADKGHFHHRLLAMGLNQKQAVAVLYGVSAVMGLVAVLLTGRDTFLRIICVVAAFIISLSVWLFVLYQKPKDKNGHEHDDKKKPAELAETSPADGDKNNIK